MDQFGIQQSALNIAKCSEYWFILFLRSGLMWDDVKLCQIYTMGSLAPFVIIMQQEWYVKEV